MPRQPTVTFEQVAAIADTILTEGGSPSARAVRDRLNTGSMGTIHKLFQQWKLGQDRQIDPALTLPPSVQRSVLEYMSQELAAGRASLESELVLQQQVANDLASENEHQVSLIEEQELALGELRSEMAAQGGKLARVEADYAMAIDQAGREREAAELARTELAKAQLRLEALPRMESELVLTHEALDAERLARTDAEKKAAVAEEKALGLQARLSDFQEKVASENKARIEAEKLAASCARELADIRIASHAVQTAFEISKREVVELKQTMEDARAKVKIADKEIAECRARLQAASATETVD